MGRSARPRHRAGYLPELLDVVPAIRATPITRSVGPTAGLAWGWHSFGLRRASRRNRHSQKRCPNRGSEFVVRLPISQAEPEIDRGNREPGRVYHPRPGTELGNPQASSGGRRQRGRGRKPAALLELSGYEVRTAFDGRAALAVAAEFNPDAVLLDIGMPGMDGYEVACRLRGDERTRKAILVALTGWGHDDDRRRAHEAGFDHHLVKPVEPDDLHTLLSSPNGQSKE